MSLVIEGVNNAKIEMIMIAFNVQTDLKKIQHLLLKILKDVYKLVQKEHFSAIYFVRNVIYHASNALVDTILIVQNVLMVMYKIQLIYSKAPKNA